MPTSTANQLSKVTLISNHEDPGTGPDPGYEVTFLRRATTMLLEKRAAVNRLSGFNGPTDERNGSRSHGLVGQLLH